MSLWAAPDKTTCQWALCRLLASPIFTVKWPAMKMRNIFLLLFLWIHSSLFSQAIDKAKELLKSNQLAQAKAAVDEIFKDPATQKNADAWYLKTKLYNAIANDPQLRKQVPGARVESFEAFKKYLAAAGTNIFALLSDRYAPVNDIYTGFYQEAANSFNQKQYANAYENFTQAIRVSTLMNEKGWINLKLDTNSVLYAGVSAEKLQRFDDAAKWYGQLADAKAIGDGFVEIYKWVANYYYEKKNVPNASHYLAIGREVFPSDTFWNELELDMARDKGDKNALFALYDKIIAAAPTNHLYRYNYAVELYQYAYNTEVTKRPANSEALIEKAVAQLGETMKTKPGYARAQLFAGQIAYNKGVDLLNKAKSIQVVNASDVKTKDDLKAAAILQFDQAAPYLITMAQLIEAQSSPNQQEKGDLKEAYDLLITIYEQKKMPDKVKEFEAKFNAVK